MFDWLWGRKGSSQAKTTAADMTGNAKAVAGTSQDMLATVEEMLANCETMVREVGKLPDSADKDEMLSSLKRQKAMLLTARTNTQHMAVVSEETSKLLADRVR
jgi:hypothetical protein